MCLHWSGVSLRQNEKTKFIKTPSPTLRERDTALNASAGAPLTKPVLHSTMAHGIETPKIRQSTRRQRSTQTVSPAISEKSGWRTSFQDSNFCTSCRSRMDKVHYVPFSPSAAPPVKVANRIDITMLFWNSRYDSGLVNFKVNRSLSPIATYHSRSTSPARRVGGSVHTPVS
jgi:hypothetical protein